MLLQPANLAKGHAHLCWLLEPFLPRAVGNLQLYCRVLTITVDADLIEAELGSGKCL